MGIGIDKFPLTRASGIKPWEKGCINNWEPEHNIQILQFPRMLSMNSHFLYTPLCSCKIFNHFTVKEFILSKRSMWEREFVVFNIATTTSIMITKVQLRALICFFFVLVSALGQDLLSCEVKSPISSSEYRCDGNRSQDQCRTFAVLRANSHYSSLSNLSLYLGINRFALAEANGFSTGTEFLPLDQPFLIPIDCKCSGGFFKAELTRTTLKGESFNGIVQSLEGLTTCKAIQEKNPTAPPWSLADKQQLLVPMKCACPSSAETNHQSKFLLSYPVTQGDTVATLALSFNTTAEDILSANDKSRADPKSEILVPFSTLLIPVRDKPRFGSLSKPWEPSLPIINRHKKKSKIRMIGVYIAVAAVAFGASIAVASAFLVLQWKRKKHGSCKGGDMELQQPSSSVRTTSEKKASFEGENDDPLNGQIIDPTPHKTLIETYTIEELRKGTEDFGSANLIEDSVYHGRLSGKNLAIKRTSSETISKIEFGLFCDAIHHYPNIIRLLGTCMTEGPDSYLVFEYAKNGSLKDWLHGGLAMKSQFIASCNCFLTWNQRLRICLDVATALQFMHHIMSPPYVHRNIKSRNIFLDEEFHAKVGNFGMARCVKDRAEEKQYSPIQPASRGKGYLAPEYLEQGVVSASIDIFAYGVVLLEILSGQTPTTRASGEGEDEVLLCEKIKLILQSENAEELREWIDNALGENYSFDTAVTLANLARACVEDDPSLRPSAGEIVERLLRLVEELPEGDQFTISEGSSKPLVKAAANSM